MKVLVTDGIASSGTAKLRNDPRVTIVDEVSDITPDKLLSIIPDYDAILLRSKTQITKKVIMAGTALKAIGRAGVGVDNIDVGMATRRGIVVFNTPTANSITTAEYTIAMMLALVRNIPQSVAALKTGKYARKDFIGRELYGKTLGIVGFGNIGRIIAKRLKTFGMEILAFDPFVASDVIELCGARSVDLHTIFKQADVLTVHTPLTSMTRGLISADVINNKLKDGVFLINCARAGIVDEVALEQALRSGKVAGAAFDVLGGGADNPLLKCDNFVASPHLGASTVEAQEKASASLAEQLLKFINSESITNAVNAPNFNAHADPNKLALALGKLFGKLTRVCPSNIAITVGQKLFDESVGLISKLVLTGFISHAVGDLNTNIINVDDRIKARGIKVTNIRDTHRQDTITISDYSGLCISGVVRSGPRLIGFNKINVDVELSGNLLIVQHTDHPGIVGKLGTFIGDAGINISQMQVSLDRATGQAVGFINVNATLSSDVLNNINGLSAVRAVDLISFS